MSADEKILCTFGFAAFQAYCIAKLPDSEMLAAAAAKREANISQATVAPKRK